MSTKDGERSGRSKEVVTADTLKISTEHVHHIVREYLCMRKLCAKWAPRESTFDQKQRRVDDSEQCLKMIKRNKPAFLRQYVTMDETWLHHFTPNFNRQSSEWTAHDEPAPKRGKTQQSVGKDEIAVKRPRLEKNKVPLHQDNAQCHKSVKTMAKIHEWGFQFLSHPPYSPYLDPATISCPQISKECSMGRNFLRMKR
ncbi:hypothetical protein GWI33_020443 [Rhynchophorus ferrugineus]|uniref:Histone-lysine N-methyltransferase SETMAR-like protein n=1 Tax=Rhynchophorus ferrugineus TaxID=354439 RepID=A0A834HSD8_RHYFE|nr:hypothetical protein GWI33_020443 [Rhynchophorus ferrugineus]